MGVYCGPPICPPPSSLCCTPSCPSTRDQHMQNEAGALVPCAQPAGVVGDSVYAYPDAVHPGFVQHGALVTVEKRDAEADPEADADADAKSWWYGYYGHPYGGYYGHHGYMEAITDSMDMVGMVMDMDIME